MIKDPSFCYKFYWLEAIVQLILENEHEASYDKIINEMIANAWYSVLEFHIHLSKRMGQRYGVDWKKDKSSKYFIEKTAIKAVTYRVYKTELTILLRLHQMELKMKN